LQVKLHFLIIITLSLFLFSLITYKSSYSENAKLPKIEFYNQYNKKVNIDNFKGNIILVNLWASWCAPCIRELPSLAKLQESLSDKKFKIIAISMDKKPIKYIRKFLDSHKAKNLDLYIDKDRKISSKWRYKGLPTSFLLDKNGVILKTYEGPFDWNKEKLIKEIRAFL